MPSATTTKKVLVIDDDENLNGSIQRKFKKVGLSSEGAFNGKQGLDLMKRERFDGILLDLKMPVLDGFGVLEGKGNTLNLDTPVYVLTAMNEKLCERHGRSARKRLSTKSIFLLWKLPNR